MSIAELKKVVHAKVDEMNDEKLELVNKYIEMINEESKARVSLLAHAMNIISERDEVLAKLAQ